MNNKNDLSADTAKLDLSSLEETAQIAVVYCKDELARLNNELQNTLSIFVCVRNTPAEARLLIDLSRITENAQRATKDLNTAMNTWRYVRGAMTRDNVEVVK
jgi:hypothetical protein